MLMNDTMRLGCSGGTEEGVGIFSTTASAESGQVNPALKLADLEVVYCGWRKILSMPSYRRTAPESTRCPQVVMHLKTGLRASTSLRLLASDFIEEQGDRGKWKGNGQTALRVVFQPQHKASSGNYRITFI